MKKRTAIQKARHLARKAKKGVKDFARGGEIDINDTFDPTEGGQIPKSLQQMVREPPKTWKPPAQIRPPRGELPTPEEDLDRFIRRRAEGGEVDDRDLPLAEADQSFGARWYDRAAGAYAMPKPPPGMFKALFREGKERHPEERDMTPYGAFGEIKGTSPEDTPIAIKTKNPLTSITEGDLERGLNTGMGSGPGIMVGPYGAFMLRQAAREKGKELGRAVRELNSDVPTAGRSHPVYAKAVEENASTLRPEFRDAYRGWQQDARDAHARGVLEMRGPKGSNNPVDQDMWEHAGWFRGADGKIRKEIPDIGASVSEVLPGKYAFDHPAGDLHKIYDIPPISNDPRMSSTEAAMYPDTNRIVLGGNLNTKTGRKKAVTGAVHEVQHVIQGKEGFSAGANPETSEFRPEFKQEFFPDASFALTAKEPYWQKDKYGHQFEKQGVPPSFGPARRQVAKQEVYERSGGEGESRNVQDRLRKTFRYLTHPENTEDTPRGLQYHEPVHKDRGAKIYTPRDLREISKSMVKGEDYVVVNPTRKAGGGQVGNFNPERAAAFGLAKQGMIKSNIPGRTDKIKMNVPNGSYIIPADIPSAIGQGNSDAGSDILNKMFNKGPYGMNLPKKRGGMRVGNRKASLSMGFAQGGFTAGNYFGMGAGQPSGENSYGGAPSAPTPSAGNLSGPVFDSAPTVGNPAPAPTGGSATTIGSPAPAPVSSQSAGAMPSFGGMTGNFMQQAFAPVQQALAPYGGWRGLFGGNNAFGGGQSQTPTPQAPQQNPYRFFGAGMQNNMQNQALGQSRAFTPWGRPNYAEGGEVGEQPDDATPIVAAGGEYVLHPDTVLELGGGDMDLGHAILDDFVKEVRAKHISTLKGLKPPKGSE